MTNCLRTADKKVDNQRISLGLMSSFKCLLAIRCGCLVLKAGEKLMNRIQTNEPAKECVRSLVLLSCLYTNWYGSKWVFMRFKSWWMMICSKHFIIVDVRATG